MKDVADSRRQGDARPLDRGDPAGTDARDDLGRSESRSLTLGVQEPWSESLANSASERYRLDHDQQRRFEAAHAAQGFDEDTVKMINAGWLTDPGRRYNCAENARAVASTLEGEPRVAAAYDTPPGQKGEPIWITERWTGERFDKTLTTDGAAGFDALEDEIRRGGPGSHAIVVIGKDDLGHAYNIENKDGKVRYVDAQTPPHFFSPESRRAQGRRDVDWMAWIRMH